MLRRDKCLLHSRGRELPLHLKSQLLSAHRGPQKRFPPKYIVPYTLLDHNFSSPIECLGSQVSLHTGPHCWLWPLIAASHRHPSFGPHSLAGVDSDLNQNIPHTLLWLLGSCILMSPLFHHLIHNHDCFHDSL